MAEKNNTGSNYYRRTLSSRPHQWSPDLSSSCVRLHRLNMFYKIQPLEITRLFQNDTTTSANSPWLKSFIFLNEWWWQNSLSNNLKSLTSVWCRNHSHTYTHTHTHWVGEHGFLLSPSSRAFINSSMNKSHTHVHDTAAFAVVTHKLNTNVPTLIFHWNEKSQLARLDVGMQAESAGSTLTVEQESCLDMSPVFQFNWF